MTIVESVFWLLAIAIAAPTLVLAFEVLLSMVGREVERNGDVARTSVGRYAILVPAHNEERELPKTLAALRCEVDKFADVLVVADNCSDGTAKVARAAGASVLQRSDSVRRGKGFALAAGLDRLAGDPPEVVVFLDADSRPASGSVRSLAAAAQQSDRPVQGIYLLDGPAGDPRAAISWLAMLFKNLVRPRGWTRLGGPCPLTGTGFALPWALVEKADFGSAHIVEDMQLGVDLALAGYPPLRCSEAMVTSPMAPTSDSATTQRTRWEHGHLQTILTQVPRLLGGFLRRRDPRLLLMAIDLAVPPLSLLVILWTVVAAILAVGLTSGVRAPLVLHLGCGLLMVLVVGAGWYRFARKVIPFSRLLAVPLYVAWKIPIYLMFLFHRQQAWVRTQRG